VDATQYPTFEGEVVHGTETGRTLGFPTANVNPATDNFPKDGVYLAQTQIDNLFYYGIMSIGNRPTFDAEIRTIEVHLLDFSGDLYQQTLAIKPLFRIRDNKKFENTDSLKQQLQNDKDFALQYLQKEN
jgi:riboflavin kinase/FMN adenylyltransferase